MSEHPVRERVVVALIAAVLPAVSLLPALGGFKVPGMRGEILFASLVGPQDPLDAVSPAAAAIQALLALVVEDLTAMGLLAVLGLWCAGVGGYALGRRHGVAVAALGLVALQLTPAILRGQWAGEVAIWGLGPAALAIAGVVAAPALAALATLFCWPLGLVVLAARFRCRWTWAAVLPLLLLQFASAPSTDASALRQAEPERRTVLAYVTGDGAALPIPALALPPMDATPRPHAGWLALAGLLAAVVLGPKESRVVGFVGLGLGAVLTLGTGWLPSPGLPPPRAADWWFALAPPGIGRGGSGWAAAVGLAGLVGVLAVAARHRAVVAICGLAVVIEALMGTSIRSPITVLPPDPALSTLETSDGDVLVWPAQDPPFWQGQTSSAELDFFVGERASSPVWVRLLSAMDDQAVDAQAAEAIWTSRADRAEEQGLSWLLVHRGEVRNADALEGWLAGTVGAPVAVSEEWVLYALE